jgi:hypothetical protein
LFGDIVYIIQDDCLELFRLEPEGSYDGYQFLPVSTAAIEADDEKHTCSYWTLGQSRACCWLNSNL